MTFKFPPTQSHNINVGREIMRCSDNCRMLLVLLESMLIKTMKCSSFTLCHALHG